jgi:transcriptional regulator with XRE-family HTH domain
MATVSDRHAGGRPRTIPRCPLGKRIEDLALRQGMTMEQLAAAARIPVSTLYRVTTGETPDPRVSTVQAIAAALRITVDRLIATPRRSTRRTA